MVRPFLRFGRWLAIVLIASGIGISAVQAQVYPKHDGYFTNQLSIVTPEEDQRIETHLKTIEAATSHEIGVAVIKSLDDQTLEEYANGLFAFWGIGKKGTDNGVLLLLVPEERKIRIEVGYGLEGALTDTESAQIISEMKPLLQSANYYEAIMLGIDRVDEAIRSEIVPPVQQGNHDREMIYLFFIFMFFLPLVVFLAVAYYPLKALFVWQLFGRRQSYRQTFFDVIPMKSTKNVWSTDSSSSSSDSSSSSSSSSSSDFGGGSSGGGGASGSW